MSKYIKGLLYYLKKLLTNIAYYLCLAADGAGNCIKSILKAACWDFCDICD